MSETTASPNGFSKGNQGVIHQLLDDLKLSSMSVDTTIQDSPLKTALPSISEERLQDLRDASLSSILLDGAQQPSTTVVENFPELDLRASSSGNPSSQTKRASDSMFSQTFQKQLNSQRMKILFEEYKDIQQLRATNHHIVSDEIFGRESDSRSMKNQIEKKIRTTMRTLYKGTSSSTPDVIEETIQRARMEDRLEELLHALELKAQKVHFSRPNDMKKEETAKSPPPSSFLTISSIQMQLASLQHWHQIALQSTGSKTHRGEASRLVTQTSLALISLLQDLPLGVLGALTSWEQQVLNKVVDTLKSLKVERPSGGSLEESATGNATTTEAESDVQATPSSTGSMFVRSNNTNFSENDSSSARSSVEVKWEADSKVEEDVLESKVSKCSSVDALLLALGIQRGSLACTLSGVNWLTSRELDERGTGDSELLSLPSDLGELLRRFAIASVRCPLQVSALLKEKNNRREFHLRIPNISHARRNSRSRKQNESTSSEAGENQGKNSSTRPGYRPNGEKLQVGDSVFAVSGISNPVLEVNEVGKIICDDGSAMPYQVSGPQGTLEYWFKPNQLMFADRKPIARSLSISSADTSIVDVPRLPLRSFEYESIALSADGRFAYVMGESVNGLVKVGTGMSSPGSTATAAGQVYQSREFFEGSRKNQPLTIHAKLVVVAGKLLVVTRPRGGSRLFLTEIDPDTLEDVVESKVGEFAKDNSKSLSSFCAAELSIPYVQKASIELEQYRASNGTLSSVAGGVKLSINDQAKYPEDEEADEKDSNESTYVWCGPYRGLAPDGGVLLGEGKWYFEVKQTNPGACIVGWVSHKFEFPSRQSNASVGHAPHSWGLNLARGTRVVGGEETSLVPKVSPGDIVGCEVEIVKAVNGRKVTWKASMKFSVNNGPSTTLVDHLELDTLEIDDQTVVGVRPAVSIIQPLTKAEIPASSSVEERDSPSTNGEPQRADPEAISEGTSTTSDAEVATVVCNVGLSSPLTYPPPKTKSLIDALEEPAFQNTQIASLSSRLRATGRLPPMAFSNKTVVQIGHGDALLPFPLAADSNDAPKEQNGIGKEIIVSMHDLKLEVMEGSMRPVDFESTVLRFTPEGALPTGFPLLSNFEGWKIFTNGHEVVVVCDTPASGATHVNEGDEKWKHRRRVGILSIENSSNSKVPSENWSSPLYEVGEMKESFDRIRVVNGDEKEYVVPCSTFVYSQPQSVLCSWFATLNTFEIVVHNGLDIEAWTSMNKTNDMMISARSFTPLGDASNNEDGDGGEDSHTNESYSLSGLSGHLGKPEMLVSRLKLCHLIFTTAARLCEPFHRAITQGGSTSRPNSRAMLILSSIIQEGQLVLQDIFVEPSLTTIASLADFVESLLTPEIFARGNTSRDRMYSETTTALLKILLVNLFVLVQYSTSPQTTSEALKQKEMSLGSSGNQNRFVDVRSAAFTSSLRRIRTRLYDVITKLNTNSELDRATAQLTDLIVQVLVYGSDLFWSTTEQVATVQKEMEFFNGIQKKVRTSTTEEFANVPSSQDDVAEKQMDSPEHTKKSSVNSKIVQGGLDIRARCVSGLLSKLHTKLIAGPCDQHVDFFQPLMDSMLKFAALSGLASIAQHTYTFNTIIENSVSAAIGGLMTSCFTTVTAAIHEGTSSLEPGSSSFEALSQALKVHFSVLRCSKQLLESALSLIGEPAASTPTAKSPGDQPGTQPCSVPTTLRVGKALQESIVGTALPVGLCWIEMMMRWRSSTMVPLAQKLRSAAMRILLLNDPSLDMTTCLVGLVIRVSAALAETKHPETKMFRCQWGRVEHKKMEFESNHDYENDARKKWLIAIPGARSMTVVFDPRTKTEVRRDFLRFLRVHPDGSVYQGGYHDSAPEEERFGEERYSGETGWPGTDDCPSLVIPASECMCTFTSDSSDVYWGYRFTVSAQVLHTTTVMCHPWHAHMTSVVRDLSSALVFATLRTASPLTESESRLLRWVQNPILSGGLRNYEAPHPVSMTRSDSVIAKDSAGLVSSRARSRTMSMSEEDQDSAQAMLVELCKMAKGGAGEKLFLALRAKRVPLDQGFFTHAAAAAMAAALFKVNGLEKDALKAVRTGELTPRLLRVWSAAQHIRRWVDQIVVNGQHKRHLEACGVPSSEIPRETDGVSADDYEGAQYNALCKLVSQRALFLVDSVEPPTLRMVSLRSSRQEIARARWHRLRQHFCPSTNQPVQDLDRWDIVLRGIRAIRSLRSMIDMRQSAALRVAAPISRQLTARRYSQSRQVPSETYLLRSSYGDYGNTGDKRARAMSHPLPAPAVPPLLEPLGRGDSVDSNFEMYPLLESEADSDRVSLHARNDSEGLPPAPSQRARPVLSTRSVSDSDGYVVGASLDSNSTSVQGRMFPSSSIITPTSLGLGGPNRAPSRRRRRERISGGLRRSSVSSLGTAGGWEGGNDVDMTFQEQEQSLSESVVSFLQSTSSIDNDEMQRALQDRNRRAQVRIAGFDLVNALVALSKSTAKPSHAGKSLFDSVVRSTTEALRGQHTAHMIDFIPLVADNTSETTKHAEDANEEHELEDGVASCDGMEAHYLTDLAGCNIAYRNSVATRFLTFLKSMSTMVQRGVRKFEPVRIHSMESAVQGSGPRSSSLTIKVPPPPVSSSQRNRTFRQLQQLLQAAAFDYVENDYGILAQSELVPALLSVLLACNTTENAPALDTQSAYAALPECNTLGQVSWRLFELLLKRCVCESGQQISKAQAKPDAPADTMSSGHGLQQSLLDLLVALLQRTLSTPNPVVRAESSMASHVQATLRKAELFPHLGRAWELGVLPCDHVVQFPAPSMVAPAVSLGLSHVLHFSLTCDVPGVYTPGRLFSVGNPASQLNPGLKPSQFSCSTQSPTSSRWLWMEVSLDPMMRVVVTLGDETEQEVEVVSRHSLESQPGTVNDVYVCVIGCSSVEVHIVKMLNRNSSLTPKRRLGSPAVASLPSEPVYAVDRFVGVLDGAGALSPIGQATQAVIGAAKSTLETSKGDIVVVNRGPYQGQRGVILDKVGSEEAEVLFPNSDQPVNIAISALEVMFYDNQSRESLMQSISELRRLLTDTEHVEHVDRLLARLERGELPGPEAREQLKKLEELCIAASSSASPVRAIEPNSPGSPHLPPPPAPRSESETMHRDSPLNSPNGATVTQTTADPTERLSAGQGLALDAPIYIGSLSQNGMKEKHSEPAGGVGLFGLTVLRNGTLEVPERFAQAKTRMSSSQCLVDYNVYDAMSVASPVRSSIRPKPNKFSAAPPTPKLSFVAPTEDDEGKGEPEIKIPRNAFKGDFSVFRVLSLASTTVNSAVGKARLSAPYPLGLMFRTVMSNSSSLEVRICAARILRSLLLHVTPRSASSCFAAACPEMHKQFEPTDGYALEDGWSVVLGFTSLIGEALFVWGWHLRNRDRNGSSEQESAPKPALRAEATMATTMAYEVIDILHALCEKPFWAKMIGKWVAVAFARVDGSLLQSVRSGASCDEGDLARCQDCVVAMAIMGGVYDSVRVGGRSSLVTGTSANSAGATSAHREPVVVVSAGRRGKASGGSPRGSALAPPDVGGRQQAPESYQAGTDSVGGSPRRRAGSPRHSESENPVGTTTSPAEGEGEQPGSSLVEITKSMKVAVSTDARRSAGGSAAYMLDSQSNNFWESNGYTPHWVELTCPKGFGLGTVSIRTDVNFDSYSPRKVTVKLGSDRYNLRVIRVVELEQRTAWVRLVWEKDVMQTDRTFLLEITRNHSGGCDTRIRAFRVMARPLDRTNDQSSIPCEYFQVAYLEDDATTASQPTPRGRMSQVPETTQAPSRQGDDEFEQGSLRTVRGSSLFPEPVRPPDALLMAVSGSRHYLAPIIDGFICIIGDESNNKDNVNQQGNKIGHLVMKDFRTRCLKALCCLLRSRVFMDRLGPAILPTLLKVSRKGNVANEVRLAPVAVRWSLNDHVEKEWELKISSAKESEQIVKKVENVNKQTENDGESVGDSFETPKKVPPALDTSSPSQDSVIVTDEDGNQVNDPFGARGRLGSTITFLPAGRVHRGVVMAVQPIVRGKHSWDCTLLEDSNGDETSLFGITSMSQLSKGKWSTSTGQVPSQPNFLSPTSDHWLLRSFNGNRYHRGVNQLWEGMAKLRIHPGDVVHCELDMDKGVFVMSVNDGTPIQVFRGIREEAPLGVYPCVASYGNKSFVRVKVSNVKMSFNSDGTFHSPFQQMLVRGEKTRVEQRMAKACTLLYESPHLSTAGLPSLISTWQVDSEQQRQGNPTESWSNDTSDTPTVSPPSDLDESDWESDSSESDGEEESDPGTIDPDDDASVSHHRREQLDTEIISKPAALYQLVNSSAMVDDGSDSETSGAVPTLASLEQRSQMSDSILLDPRYAYDPTWLTEACDALLTDLVSRLSAEALESLVVDWSITTPNPMPQLLLRPETLPRTLDLVFNAAMREDPNNLQTPGSAAVRASNSKHEVRSLLAIRAICGSSNRLSHRDSLVFFGDSWDPEQAADLESPDDASSPVARMRSASSVYRSITEDSGLSKTPGNPQIVAEMLDLCVSTFVTVAKALSGVKRQAATAVAVAASAASAATEAPQQKQGVVREPPAGGARSVVSHDKGLSMRRRGQVFHPQLTRTDTSRFLDTFDMMQTPTRPSSQVSPEPSSSPIGGIIALGTRVEAKLEAWRRYYPGVVTKIHTDATYQIHFEDGDVQEHVPSTLIRLLGQYAADNLPAVGDAVEARYRGQSRWYPGVVHAVNEDRTCEIHYTDGDVERSVLPEYIRPLGSTSTQSRPAARRSVTPSASSGSVEQFQLNQRIEGKFQGRSWYPGVIAAVHTDNTYDIHYNDGDREFYVNPAMIRPLVRDVRPATSPGASTEASTATTSGQSAPDPAAPVAANVSGSTMLEQGMQYLLSDRFGADLPTEGKADSAQVSIINHPAVADGVVVSITMRLADTPAGGSDTWDVMVFEMLGEGTCSFLVVQDGSKPAHGTIKFDPNSREPQILPVQGKLRIAQGQYLGVMNRKGRLNVSYTPGKKKPGESWSDKPVEVFYLMPRAVPQPFVGGPHRAKQWHGRAGWYSYVSVEHPAGVDTMLHRKHLVNLALEELTIFPETHPIKAHNALRQACWLLRTLVSERFVFAGELFAIEDLVTAIRKISKCGLFLVDAASPADNAELTPNISKIWLPVISMVTELAQALSLDGLRCGEGMGQLDSPEHSHGEQPPLSLSELHLPIPPSPTRIILRLRNLVERRACEMFIARQRWSEKEALKGGSGSGDMSSGGIGSQGNQGQSGDTTLWFQRLLQCLIALNDLSANGAGDLQPPRTHGHASAPRLGSQKKVPLLSDTELGGFAGNLEVTEVTMVLDAKDDGSSIVPLIQYRCLSDDQGSMKLVVDGTNAHLVSEEPQAVEMLSQIKPGDELTHVNGILVGKLLEVVSSENVSDARIAAGMLQLALYGPIPKKNVNAIDELTHFLGVTKARMPGSSTFTLDRTTVLQQSLKSVELKFIRRSSGYNGGTKGFEGTGLELTPQTPGRLDWLNALVTATDLLKAFAESSTIPSHLLRSQFANWRQRCGRMEVESVHPLKLSDETNEKELHKIHVPGASSLQLEWDPRSCLDLSENHCLIVRGALGETETLRVCGFQGRPPPLSVIPGDTVTISACVAQGGESVGQVSSSITSPVTNKIRGLVNEKGRVIQMGTLPRQRARFYCNTGSCNGKRKGATQCADCMAFVPHNNAGFPMVPGDVLAVRAARQRGAAPNTAVSGDCVDKLYCGVERKCSPHLPHEQCGDCAKFQELMVRTKSLSLVSWKTFDSFATESEYVSFLLGVTCPGMVLRCRDAFQDIAKGDCGEVIKADRRGFCHLWWKKSRFSRWVPWRCLELVLENWKEPSSKQTGRARRASRSRPSPIVTSSPKYLEREDFDSSVLYSRYVSAHAAPGMAVRCCKSFVGEEVGALGKIVQIDDSSDDLPCQVSWTDSGSLYWVRWDCLSLNPAIGAEETDVGDPATDVVDDPRITFDVSRNGPDVEVFNNRRSATRTRSIGWGTQVMNVKLDDSHEHFTVNITIDKNASNHFFFGVVQDPAVRCMIDPHSWSIRRDGSLHRDGREMRSATPALRLETGALITMIVNMTDPTDRWMSFRSRGQELGEIHGLPESVYPAVCFGGSSQRVTITSASLKLSSTDRTNPGWGYRLVVLPEFTQQEETEKSRLVSSSDGDASEQGTQSEQGVCTQGVLEYINNQSDLGATFEVFVSLQNSWTRAQDEILCAFVNQASSSMSLSLKDLLTCAWGSLCRKRLVVRAKQSSSMDAGPMKDILDSFIQELVKLRYPSSMDGLTPSVFAKALEAVTGAASETARSGKPTGNDAVQRASRILEDIGQRYELIQRLNSSVHRALSLLDLTTWRVAGTPACHLSECCTVLFDVLKHHLWCDAINISRTQNSNKFELVLDFGRALSRRGQADIRARHTVFAQAFRVMHSMPPQELRVHGKLYKATLRGMGSHDDGGPYRQSFTQYCAELQSVPGVGLFLPCANRTNQIHVNRDRWLPNPAADSMLQLEMFEFVGKLMGIAIRNNEYLDLRLPSLVWKLLVNQMPSVEDLRAVDLLTVTNLEAVEANGGSVSDESIQGLSFTVITLDGREIELVPSGEQVAVTKENFMEWVGLTREYKLHEFDAQVNAIRRGLSTIVPQRMLMLFSWEELELMVCGQPHIDLKMLRDMTVYSDCSESDQHIQYLWKVLEEFTDEQRSMYIKFVWGRSRLPVRMEDWEQPHKLAAFHPPKPANGGPPPDVDQCLPFGHTCYFTLDVPRYSSEEIMKKKLLFAIENCPEIDGDQTTTGRRSAAMGFEIYSDDEDGDDEVNFDSADWESSVPQHRSPRASPAAAVPSLSSGVPPHRGAPYQAPLGTSLEAYDVSYPTSTTSMSSRRGAISVSGSRLSMDRVRPVIDTNLVASTSEFNASAVRSTSFDDTSSFTSLSSEDYI